MLNNFVQHHDHPSQASFWHWKRPCNFAWWIYFGKEKKKGILKNKTENRSQCELNLSLFSFSGGQFRTSKICLVKVHTHPSKNLTIFLSMVYFSLHPTHPSLFLVQPSLKHCKRLWLQLLLQVPIFLDTHHYSLGVVCFGSLVSLYLLSFHLSLDPIFHQGVLGRGSCSCFWAWVCERARMVGALSVVASSVVVDSHTSPCLCVDGILTTSVNLMSGGGDVTWKNLMGRKHLMRRRSTMELSSSFTDPGREWRLSVSRSYKKQRRGDRRVAIVNELGGQYEDTFEDVKTVI